MDILPTCKLVSFDIVDCLPRKPSKCHGNNLIYIRLTKTDELITKNGIEAKLFFLFPATVCSPPPLNGLLAEIYVNLYENKYVLSSCNKFHKNIISCTRYMDDAFVIFIGTRRQIEMFIKYINSVNHEISFTMELKNNACLNFIDLSM